VSRGLPGLAAAAALALVVAACRGGPPAPYTVRRGPAATPPAAPAQVPELRALVLGDFGDETAQQAAVARGVAEAHARAPFDLAFSPGDNLYDCGPDPRRPGAEACRFAEDGASVAPGFAAPADPRFDRFDARFPALRRDGSPVPVFLALGNHDVAGSGGCAEGPLRPDAQARLKACLEVAHASPVWRMPARHYVVDRGPARFIVLDSNLLLGDYGGFTLEGEITFLRGAVEGCRERPCFVVAHHPTATAAQHRVEADAAYRARVRRLEDAAGGAVAAWLCGHDHDLQHLRAAGGYDVLVSGNASRGRPSERFEEVSTPGAQLLFASTAWGYLVVEVSARGWAARFNSIEGSPLHCCQAAFPGRCEPVACPAP
jgi:tartrate-resistant acid phosphatase type 5